MNSLPSALWLLASFKTLCSGWGSILVLHMSKIGGQLLRVTRKTLQTPKNLPNLLRPEGPPLGHRSFHLRDDYISVEVYFRNLPKRKLGILVQFSRSVMSDSLWPPLDCSMPALPIHHQLPEFTQTHVHWVSDAIQTSHPLTSPSSPIFNLSQHQGLFQWVSSSHQVVKGLEFQLRHQSFQWIFRTDFL